ncbi:MAG: universal stress protein [Acidimicrobiia bacterium]
MHLLVATTGVLRPAPVVDLCDRLLGAEGVVTVMTVIEVPRTFLQTMDEEERRSFLDDRGWETDTAQMMALGYLEERGRRVVEPIVAALRASGRVPAVAFVEGYDPAEAIVSQARASGADLIVMGATKRLFGEEAWASVSARVMERTLVPLVLIPGARAEEPADEAE